MNFRLILATTFLTFSVNYTLAETLLTIDFSTVDDQKDYISKSGNDYEEFLPKWGLAKSQKQEDVPTTNLTPSNVIPAINTWDDFKKLLTTTQVLSNEGISQSAFNKLSPDHMRGLSALLSINNDTLRQLNMPEYFKDSIKQNYTIGGNKLFKDDKDHEHEIYQKIDAQLETLLYGNKELISAIKDMILSRFNVRKGVITGYDNLMKFLPVDTKENQDFSLMQQQFFKRIEDDKIPMYSEIAGSKMNEYMLLACIVPCLQKMFMQLKDFSIQEINKLIDELNPFLALKLSNNKTVVERIYANAMRDIQHLEKIDELYKKNNFEIANYETIFNALSTTSSLKDIKDQCIAFFARMKDEYKNKTTSNKVAKIRGDIKEINKQLKSIENAANVQDNKQRKAELDAKKKELEDLLKTDEYIEYRWTERVKNGPFLELKNKAQELEDSKLFNLLRKFEIQANMDSSKQKIVKKIEDEYNPQIQELKYSSVIAEYIMNLINYKKELKNRQSKYEGLKQNSQEYANLYTDIDASLAGLTKLNMDKLITKLNQYKTIDTSLKAIDETIQNIASCLKNTLNINDYEENKNKPIKYNDFNAWFDQTSYTKETISVDYKKLQQDISIALEYYNKETNLRDTVKKLLDIVNKSGFIESIDNANVFVEPLRSSNDIASLLKDFYYYADLECDNIVANRIKILKDKCPRQVKEDKAQVKENQQEVEETQNRLNFMENLKKMYADKSTSMPQARFKITKPSNTKQAENQSDKQQEKEVTVKVKKRKQCGQYLHILQQMKDIPDSQFKEELQQLLLNLRGIYESKNIEDIKDSIGKINKLLLLPKEIRDVCETINNAAGEKEKIEKFFDAFNSVKGKAREIRNKLNDLIMVCYHLSTELKDGFCGAVYTKLINYYAKESGSVIYDAIDYIADRSSEEKRNAFENRISKEIQNAEEAITKFQKDNDAVINDNLETVKKRAIAYKDEVKRFIDKFSEKVITLDADVVEAICKKFKDISFITDVSKMRIYLDKTQIKTDISKLKSVGEISTYYTNKIKDIEVEIQRVTGNLFNIVNQQYPSLSHDDVRNIITASILFNSALCDIGNITKRLIDQKTNIENKKFDVLNLIKSFILTNEQYRNQIDSYNNIKQLFQKVEEAYNKCIDDKIRGQQIRTDKLKNLRTNPRIKFVDLLKICNTSDFSDITTMQENLSIESNQNDSVLLTGEINKPCVDLYDAIKAMHNKVSNINFNHTTNSKNVANTQETNEAIKAMDKSQIPADRIKSILCVDEIQKNIPVYESIPLIIIDTYKEMQRNLNKLMEIKRITYEAINSQIDIVKFCQQMNNDTINAKVDPTYYEQCGDFWKRIVQYFDDVLRNKASDLIFYTNNEYASKDEKDSAGNQNPVTYMRCFPSITLPNLNGGIPRLDDMGNRNAMKEEEDKIGYYDTKDYDFRKIVDRMSLIRDYINEAHGDSRKILSDKLEQQTPDTTFRINVLMYQKPRDSVSEIKVRLTGLENLNYGKTMSALPDAASGPSQPPPGWVGPWPPPPAPKLDMSKVSGASTPGATGNPPPPPGAQMPMPKDLPDFANKIVQVIRDNMVHVNNDNIDTYHGLYKLVKGKVQANISRLAGNDSIYSLCKKYASFFDVSIPEDKEDTWYVKWLQDEIKQRVDPKFHSLPVFSYKP